MSNWTLIAAFLLLLLISIATTTTFVNAATTPEHEALDHDHDGGRRGALSMLALDPYSGLLASWNANTSKVDFIVAQDNSSPYNTINKVMVALSTKGTKQPERVVIYVKAGVYNEQVNIGENMTNIMLVGDGMDRTVVTGSKNVVDGYNIITSATFTVSGEGFWARDMTFENTAGPHKQQAVALLVSSNQSIFYQCSFKGYQDTLYTHSNWQFYRDCHVYGTIDFIFGDSTVVFQNCSIFVRRPMRHQDNVVTAQGRESKENNTGISIHMSQIIPAPDLVPVKGSFKTYLGRPWKNYSRTVIIRTFIDKFIEPQGWNEWTGDFLMTLFYGEYSNSGLGATTGRRVNWTGFLVLKSLQEAEPFSVRNFIQGHLWIPRTGIPVVLDI